MIIIDDQYRCERVREPSSRSTAASPATSFELAWKPGGPPPRLGRASMITPGVAASVPDEESEREGVDAQWEARADASVHALLASVDGSLTQSSAEPLPTGADPSALSAEAVLAASSPGPGSDAPGLLPDPPRNRRTIFTNEQVQVLTRIFDVNPVPSAHMRTTIARSLSMNPRSVQVWFQNRRQRIKFHEVMGAAARRDEAGQPPQQVATAYPINTVKAVPISAPVVATKRVDAHPVQAHPRRAGAAPVAANQIDPSSAEVPTEARVLLVNAAPIVTATRICPTERAAAAASAVPAATSASLAGGTVERAPDVHAARAAEIEHRPSHADPAVAHIASLDDDPAELPPRWARPTTQPRREAPPHGSSEVHPYYQPGAYGPVPAHQARLPAHWRGGIGRYGRYRLDDPYLPPPYSAEHHPGYYPPLAPPAYGAIGPMMPPFGAAAGEAEGVLTRQAGGSAEGIIGGYGYGHRQAYLERSPYSARGLYDAPPYAADGAYAPPLAPYDARERSATALDLYANYPLPYELGRSVHDTYPHRNVLGYPPGAGGMY